MRITKWRRVGNHDSRITVLPESPLIRPTDAWNERGKSGAFGGDPRVFTEESDGAAEQRTRMNIAYKSDKVADRGIENTQAQRRISLGMRHVRKISDRFQANHGGYLIAARLASASVNKTSHLLCQKVRRLLVRKRNKAQSVLQRSTGKAPRQSERCSHAGAVVVGAGRAKHRVVMRADQKNVRTSARNFGFDIVAGLPAHVVTVATRLETSA